MNMNNSILRGFLVIGLGYAAGALAGFLFIYLLGRLGFINWLFGLVDKQQTFLQILAVPLIAWFMLSLAGALTGVIGGWVLTRNPTLQNNRGLFLGGGIAFAASTGILLMAFLLFITFISVYNNFNENRVEQYGILFGLFGLVFGLLTGIILAFTTVRLRYTWQVILASTFGFTLGGVIAGLIIRWINPLNGLETNPIITTLILVLGLVLPYFFGGGALGFVYQQITRKVIGSGEPVESVQPSGLQILIVAVLALIVILPIANFIGRLSDFLTIRPANLQSVISPVTVGVRWSESRQLDSGEFSINQYTSAGDRAVVEDEDGNTHQVWCSAGGVIHYQRGSKPLMQIKSPPCSSTPAVALDLEGDPHIVWYARELRDTNGITKPSSALVESILLGGVWSEAAIAAYTRGEVQHSLSLDEKGNLILTWEEISDPPGSSYSSKQEHYQCTDEQLSEVERAGVENLLAGGTRPEGVDIPYCRNQFDRIIYTPNPLPAYSDQQATQNGGFDQVSALVEEAEYEVLFNVMQYVGSKDGQSPGMLLAESIEVLYNRLKTNPEKFPRGMTVRILLGNYPVFSDLNWGSQIMEVIKDLKAVGIEKMVDPEIGWRVEVANYPGVYPHSHNKMFVVDGKLAGGLGFNYNYIHYEKDHPSGEGDGLFDLGMTATGPVAQETIARYDDMWNGADQIHCEDLSLPDGEWEKTCRELKAVDDHVPEVLRAYLPAEGDSNAFSLYRTKEFNEADDFIAASLAASTKSIDLITANFSMEPYCIIHLIVPGFCTLVDATTYVEAILDAVKNNNTHVRIIMENANSYGLENRVTAMVLYPELVQRGLDDQVELRFFDGRVHSKSGLIDDTLLVIGSQNFQYSAWGKGGGLGENMLATSDPEAIAEYKALFEFKWKQAVPVEEAEYGTTSK